MELPVVDFIRTRIQEVDPEFETRPGSVYHEMFIKPQMLMLQPLGNSLDQIQVSQSIHRILSQPDPDAYSSSDVDDLVSNLYVYRDTGAQATTVVRVYYTSPRDKQFPAYAAEFTSGSLSFFNISDIYITTSQMSLQTEGSLYYMDVPVISQTASSDFNIAVGTITGFVNDTEAVMVTNTTPATGGMTSETNTQLLTRAANSIGVRDLETVKGINAILRGKFPFIQSLTSVGFGDPEMMRDVLYNAHVGGKTDVYIKTQGLITATQDFVGLDYDTTRAIDHQIHAEMAKSADDPLIPSFTGTPQIVPGSVRVVEDVVETTAYVETVVIPNSTGINLEGAEYVQLQVDELEPTLIKISGAVPKNTQSYEIVNAINSAIGYPVAAITSSKKVRIKSLKVGSKSYVSFSDLTLNPTLNNAAMALFGSSNFGVSGVAAEVYTELIDFEVDYISGNIYQKEYNTRSLPTILSGQTMVTGSGGFISYSGGSYYFKDNSLPFYKETPPAVKVRTGDLLTINSVGGLTTGTVLGDLPQTFVITDMPDTGTLSLLEFLPSATATDISYTVQSNQAVVINYQYNPISIDIGGQVLLSDGLLRGVRPGRNEYTIKNTPFINVVSIQEVDPESGELLGSPLIPPNGYGYGGFGEGSYGVGAGGDYEFRVLAPRDRFSVFDDAVILMSEAALLKSYRVTYQWVPEIVSIHDLCRNDSERVTGADVLPRHYVPAFVDMQIGIRRDATNLSTPSNDGLATLVKNFVNLKSGAAGIQASDISKLLEDQGVDSVQTPFNMSATVLNTDGTTTILESTDILVYPDVTLEKDTDMYVTKNIVYFVSNNITVVEVA